ncbi:hypothetical protein PB16LOC_01040 [Pectobacterium versatile]|uniref:hypothetical protein n=1 Tax=Pectobacterium versatile TaxID=2488639 RepID=UPI000F8EA1F7|nr:hypothetical protein [Pectobacterium versatile]RUR94743.1 hypothetical protein PB16LOC_01040 [Pectobacterium versatile]
MSLIAQKTKWVLFLSSSQPKAEARHVLDLVYGLMCLESAGVKPDDISIYIDSPTQNFDGLFSLASTNIYHSKPTDNFFSDQENNKHENLVMFITGHGNPFGIDAVTPITPEKLLSTVKCMKGLGNAVIYLGQCYAGIFNYVNAGRARRKAGDGPEIVLIGATNLHESLSLSTTEKMLEGEIPWLANQFLLHVFKWFSAPVDIDGDGQSTIMDSYKYAGVFSNMHNKVMKNRGFIQMIDLHHEWRDLKNIAENDAGDDVTNLDNKVNCAAKFEMYVNSLEIHHVHQECWVLNSYPAQQITI